MRVVIIVQARMTSSRLPGKVLRPILGRPLLVYLLERLKTVERADSLVLATTLNDTDDPIAELCEEMGIPVYRGSEDDVLSRYHMAASAEKADVVVRITADCPLIDPVMVNDMIGAFLDRTPAISYMSNTLVRTFPRGMDAEVFLYEALDVAQREALEPYEREHVTPYLYSCPGRFALSNFESKGPRADKYRWTVDEEDDFLLVGKILEALYPSKRMFELKDMLELIQAHPDWVEINSHVEQKKAPSM